MSFIQIEQIVFDVVLIVTVAYLINTVKAQDRAIKILLYGVDKYVRGIPGLIGEMESEKRSRYNE
jgi:hypothetical protein